MVFLATVTTVVFFWQYWLAWLAYVVIILLMAFSEFIWPLITQKAKGSYAEKLVGQDQIEQEAKVHLLWHVVDSKYGRWLVTTLVWVYLAIAFTHVVGLQSAVSRRIFDVPDGVSDTAIVAIYDDTMISAKFDPDSRELTGSLRIVKLADKSPLAIHAEIVGPLKWRNIPTRDGSAKAK